MKNIVYIKTYNPNQEVKLISINAKTSQPNIWVPGNNSLENFGMLNSAKNFFLNIGANDVKIPKPDLIVNCIADCDIFCDRLKILCDDLENMGSYQIINHPKYVLKTSRDEIWRSLKNIKNLVVPKTIKLIANNRKDFVRKLKEEFSDQNDILIRKVASHNGESLIRVNFFSPEFDEKLDIISFNNQYYYATQFCDFRSSDSLYRKIRIVMINGVAYLRHQIISDNWNIHSDSRKFMTENEKLKREEELFLQDSMENIRPILAEIYQQVKLDIFGIDCALIEKNKILIFEVNASMEFIAQDTTKFRYLDHSIREIKNAFLAMLKEKIST
jgi:glutathione synthase/RimK-type ligase-like ATP-grasp enzyme